MVSKIEYEDIYNIDSFYMMNLSDFNAVKLLIQFRDKYDNYYSVAQNNHFNQAGNVEVMNENMIIAFTYLDELISRCKFSEQQLTIIKMIQEGYTYQEIANHLGFSKNDNIRKRFNKICRDIVKMNDWLWRKYIYINKLGLKTKRCSKCKEDLPATDEFFSPDERISDGFHSQCRLCRQITS